MAGKIKASNALDLFEGLERIKTLCRIHGHVSTTNRELAKRVMVLLEWIEEAPCTDYLVRIEYVQTKFENYDHELLNAVRESLLLVYMKLRQGLGQ